MKKLFISLILMFAMQTTAWCFPGSANIGAVTSNPGDGTVLATTGALSSGCASGTGIYKVEVFVSSSAAATFDLKTISGGNPVAHVYMMTPASSSVHYASGISFAIPDGLTLSLVNVGALALATVQANLFWTVEKCQ